MTPIARLVEQRSNRAVTDSEFALSRLLARHGVDVAPLELASLLAVRPSYPSLRASFEAVQALGVPCEVVPVQRGALAELTPCVGMFQGQLVLIDRVHEGGVELVQLQAGRRRVARESFGAGFGRVVLRVTGPVVATPALIERVRRTRARRRSTRVLWMCAALWLAHVASLAPAAPGPRAAWLAVVAANVVGLAATWSLLALELGRATVLGRALCPLVGGPSSCVTVLSSRLSRLRGVSLIDVAVVIFSAQQLAFAAGPPLGAGAWSSYALFAAVPALGAVAAIVAQAVVLRAWCRLCVLVDAALLAQGVVMAWCSARTGWAAPDLRAGLGVGAALLTVFALWVLARPAVEALASQPAIRAALRRVVRSQGVARALLDAARELDLGELPGDVVLGPSSAPWQLGVIATARCTTCAVLVPELVSLQATSGERARLRIRMISGPGEDDAARRATGAVVGAARRGDAAAAAGALVGFYVRGEGGPADGSPEVTAILDENARWCAGHEVRATPVFVVNGREAPPPLTVEDVAFLVVQDEAIPVESAVATLFGR